MIIKITYWIVIFVIIQSNYGIDPDLVDQIFSGLYDENFQLKSSKFDSYNNPSPAETYPDICNEYNSEICAKEWLKEIQNVFIRNLNRNSNLHFKYLTDINAENSKQLKLLQKKLVKYNHDMFKKARKFKWKSFKNAEVKRIFKSITPTVVNKNLKIVYKLNNINRKISLIYNKANPTYKNKPLGSGEYGIELLFKTNRDYDTLAGYWKSWRDQIGPKMRKYYIERRDLQNIGAKEHGYNDVKQFSLLMDFDQKNFNETIMKVFDNILPFYQQLHAFVRHCLWKYYPNRFDKDGPIPAHILGNVWAQQWVNIFPIIKKCYKSTVTTDITKEVDKSLSKKSIKDMFKMSEKFFESIGMFKMVDNFWSRSMLKKPKKKLVDCHGSASDYNIGTDYRIKMCTSKNLVDFTTIHHEMGHVEYYMAYNDLPFFLRGGANSGFHEAIGDTIALSVKTPEHLKKVGLIKDVPRSKEFDIDYLMERALEKVVFLPYALTMEVFSWSVYNGSVADDKLNEYWWSLRRKFQGLKPPVKRSENDFDPGAKYHVAHDVSYLRYFFSFICQFEFYEAMCKEAGEYDKSKSLHRCDFYGSKKAGKKFLDMLKQGQRQNWAKTMEMLTGAAKPGESVFNTKSLLKYFKPLHDWLKVTNKHLNIKVGW